MSSSIKSSFWCLLLLAILFSGCTGMFKDSLDTYYNLESGAVKTVSIYDGADACVKADCNCFICQKPSEESTSLLGSNCFIDSSCNKDRFDKLINSQENTKENLLSIRQFMIGQGESFYDFNAGNKLCSNSLDMAVKWLHVKDDDAYLFNPKPERASCFLSQNVMPVYVLSAEDNFISKSKAGAIASSLNGIGPIIITTQINPNSSKSESVQAIKDQVSAIDSNCQNCMVALSVRFKDTKFLDDILSDESIKTKVDLVSYGLDSRYSESKCRVETLYQEGEDFAQHALMDYKKPSIWVYAIIEKNGNDASDSGCTWDEKSQPYLYNYFFKTEIQLVIKNGVIGFAPYSLYGIENPLGCNDCSFVTPSADDKEFNQIIAENGNQPAISHWFGLCNLYANPGITSTGKMFSVFPIQYLNSVGCGFNKGNLAEFFAQDQEIQAKTTQGNPQPLDLEISKNSFTCDFCVAGNDLANAPKFISKISVSSEVSTKYNSLDVYADKFDVDPLLLRALVSHESNFNPCAASIVAKSNSIKNQYSSKYSNIFVGGCYNAKLSDVPDPSGVCTIEPLPDGLSYCAFGLGQSKTIPSDMWADFTGNSQYVKKQLSQICSDTFNPYDPNNASCVAAYQLRSFWDQASSIVDSNKIALDVSDNADKSNWAKAFLTIYFYGNGGDQSKVNSWISEYSTAKTTKTCDLESSNDVPSFNPSTEEVSTHEAQKAMSADNFVDYLVECQKISKVKATTNVMGRYMSLLSDYKGENIICPYKK